MRYIRKYFTFHRLFLFLVFAILACFSFLSIIGVDLPGNPPDEYLTNEVTGRKLRYAPISWDLPFGTDYHGYDVFSQFYYGLKTNIVFSLIAAISFTILGTFLGVRLGYYKKDHKDFDKYLKQSQEKHVRMLSFATIKRLFIYQRERMILPAYFMKAFNSFPILLMVLLVAVVLQNNPWITSKNIQLGITMVVFGLISSPKLTNMILSKIQSLRAEEFIQSAIVLGIPDRVIIFKHILWLECRYLILYQFAYLMGQASILEITLKYFQYGVYPPWISWGTTLTNAFTGQMHLYMIIPIIFITTTIYFYMGVAEELKRFGERREIAQ